VRLWDLKDLYQFARFGEKCLDSLQNDLLDDHRRCRLLVVDTNIGWWGNLCSPELLNYDSWLRFYYYPPIMAFVIKQKT
jgi:hypothetical protein